MIELLEKPASDAPVLIIHHPSLEELIFSALKFFEPQAATIEGVIFEVQGENPDYDFREINSKISDLIIADRLFFDREEWRIEPEADPEEITVLKINHSYREQS